MMGVLLSYHVLPNLMLPMLFCMHSIHTALFITFGRQLPSQPAGLLLSLCLFRDDNNSYKTGVNVLGPAGIIVVVA